MLKRRLTDRAQPYIVAHTTNDHVAILIWWNVIDMLSRHVYAMILEAFLYIDDGDHRVLRQFGLTPTQFSALKQLDVADGRRLTDLTELLLVDKSTVTRLIDRLEQAQLVRRVPDPDDRRAQRVVLTPVGLECREQARAAHELSIVQRMSDLSASEQQQLVVLLEKLCAPLRVKSTPS